MRFCCTMVVLFAVSFLPAAESAETWPQWRGPNRDCRVESPAWPDTLSGTLTQSFRIPLGDGYSGPIVSHDRVFVTETVGSQEVVRAIDRFSGEEVWRVKWSGSMSVPFFAASNGSWIRSTPALSGDRLFVASMEDVLMCLDAVDGTEVWRKDFRKEFGTDNQSFGFVCSPIVWQGFVFVQTNAGLVKIDIESGETAWRSLDESGGMMGGAFSSPVIAEIHGLKQLVVQTRSHLAGVSLQSGDQLWSVPVPAFRGMNILTPTVINNRIFTSSYGGGSHLFEVEKAGNGSFEVKQVWKTKAEAYMSSPVVVDGMLYLHLRNQRFTCLDLETGATVWTTKPFGKYWSMAVNGDRSLVLDERGDLILLDLQPDEFRKLDSTNVTDESAWAHIAVADDQVFVREQKALVVYNWR